MSDEHPEWLPADWRVCVRVRSSGRKDKFYIHPLNGLRFNSKPEVLRHLKENAEKERKLKELNKIDIKKTSAERLPSGWVKEIRTIKEGGKTRRDMYYIDPVNGRQFRSMREALSYLDNEASGKEEFMGVDQDHTSGDHSKSAKTTGAKGHALIDNRVDRAFTGHEIVKSVSSSEGSSLINVDMAEEKYVEQRERHDNSVVADRPDSVLQINGERNERRVTRSQILADTNFIDDQSIQPSSEGTAVKNGKPPEANALKQREKEEYSIAEDRLHENITDQQHENVEDRQHESIGHQNKRKKSNKWMNNLPRRTSKRLAVSGSEGSSLINLDTPEEKYAEQREIEDESAVKDLPDRRLSQINGERKLECRETRSKRLAEGKPKDDAVDDLSLQPGSECAAVKKVNPPEANALEQIEKEEYPIAEDRQHDNVAHQKSKRKKSNSQWTNSLPHRTSKRLADGEASPSLEVSTRNEARKAANLSCKPENNHNNNTFGYFDKSNDPKKLSSDECSTESPTENNEQKEPTNPPVGDLSSLQDQNGVGVDSKKDGKPEFHIHSSLSDLLMDPCIEFAIKTLTGAIPIQDAIKIDEGLASSLGSALPLGQIWADPCFEFAVKTLTSEMPSVDGSIFQVPFQQSSSSSTAATGCESQSLPKIRSDKNCPLSYSFGQFDTKPFVGGQGIGDMPSQQR